MHPERTFSWPTALVLAIGILASSFLAYKGMSTPAVVSAILTMVMGNHLPFLFPLKEDPAQQATALLAQMAAQPPPEMRATFFPPLKGDCDLCPTVATHQYMTHKGLEKRCDRCFEKQFPDLIKAHPEILIKKEKTS